MAKPIATGRTLAHAYRAFAHDHPGTYPLTQRHLDDHAWEEAAARVLHYVAMALSSYGVGTDDVDRIRFVRSTLHGFLELERTGGFGLPTSIDQSFDVLIDALDLSLTALAGGA